MCVHRPLVAANYAAAASWAAATASPDASFPLSAAAATSAFCVWLVLRTHLSHHLLRTFTCSRGIHHHWELYLHANACGLLSMTGGDHLYEYTFSALRQDLRFGHVLDRVTLEGQKQHVHTRFCPSNLAMGRHLLRTVKCRGDGNYGYRSLLNGIYHRREQVRTNTAVSASIFCQRYSSFQIRWRYQPRWCLPVQHTSLIFGISPLHVHVRLYSRYTGVCICTCALRQIPHDHVRIGLLGSGCVYMYSVCVLLPRNTFPVLCTPWPGVHCRANGPQHTCAFLIAGYATLPSSLLVQASKYEHPNVHTRLLKAWVADVLVDHVTARSVADLRQKNVENQHASREYLRTRYTAAVSSTRQPCCVPAQQRLLCQSKG